MKRVLGRAIPIVFYVLLLGFLGYYLTTIDYDMLLSLSFDWPVFVLATLLGLAVLFVNVGVWIVILRSLGADLRWSSRLTLVYAKSWLGRYIPGKVPWILGKIYFASREGVSRSKLAVSSLLEAALQIVGQLVISFALLVIDPRLDVVGVEFKVVMVIALAGLLVVVLPPVFNRLMAFGARLLRRELPSEHAASWRTIASGGSLYMVVGAGNGLALFLLAKSIHPELGWDTAVFVASATILAGAVGMLAVFAPSGLGVRDGILLLLLGLVMPTEVALAVTVLSRLWSVVLDLLFFATAWIADRVRSREAPSDGG